MSIKNITELSNSYGSNPAFVLAGGGNTSYKDTNFLYIKPSGTRLADIKEENFMKINRKKVQELFAFNPPENPHERESIIKKMMSEAICDGETGRPSVETPLHEIMDFTYVVHLHPALVNGMTCGKNGKEKCLELFPNALWCDYIDPGFILAKYINDEIKKYAKENGKQPQIIIQKNHGVFVGGNTKKEINDIYTTIMDTLTNYYKKQTVSLELECKEIDIEKVAKFAPRLRSLISNDSDKITIRSVPSFTPASGALTPDHIVYAKSYALITDNPTDKEIAKFADIHQYKPLVISIPNKVIMCAGKTYKDATTVATLAKDAAYVEQLTEAFGGPEYLMDEARLFIENWEVESYRKKVAAGSGVGRLNAKVAVVTGGAQGFGYGISEELIKEGATIGVADINYDGAKSAVKTLCEKYGESKAFPIAVDVSNEQSIKEMANTILTECGGIDLLVANAGVVKPDSVKDQTLKDWNFVTNINYTGYFLCVKYIAQIMSAQNKCNENWTDIVQISSKSGLVGSNKNGAYSGSKFGGIGLTQSFALELVEDKIKVNSVCPGNFLDGPLWCDPERGLFKQYLDTGKVPGAKTLEDVKKFYERKVPMNRGCFPADVTKAIMYTVEQQYETGQAIPVTGGQVMLN